MIADLAIHILSVILPVYVATRRLAFKCERSVAHLSWQSVLEIKQASLADVLYFRAGLTDYRRLETRTGPGVPPEYCERASAGST